MKRIRSSRNIVRRAINTIAPLFKPARNSTYHAEDLAKTLLSTCLRQVSAEQNSKPSPDTMLRRLAQIDEHELERALEDKNRELLCKLNLPCLPVLALDYRTLPYYGNDQPELVSDSRLPGTTKGIRFAMLSVVERHRTFALRVHQTGPLETDTGVLREMLRGLPFRPRLLLLDRGFYSVEVVLALISVGLHFLMPAPRTPGIKRMCDAFEHGEIPATVHYTMQGQKGKAQVWLILQRKRTKEGLRTFAFISDLPFDPETAAELYGRRWRIETNNRELKHFLARTTSRSMRLRRVYYRLAAFLYDLWIVLRHAFGRLPKHQFKRGVLHLLGFSLGSLAGAGPPPS